MNHNASETFKHPGEESQRLYTPYSIGYMININNIHQFHDNTIIFMRVREQSASQTDSRPDRWIDKSSNILANELIG